jgi:hypothetical protein
MYTGVQVADVVRLGAEHGFTIRPWRRLSRAQREAVEAEAASPPLPGLDRPIAIRWDHD